MIKNLRSKRFNSVLMGALDLKKLLAEIVDHFAETEEQSMATIFDEECPPFDDDRAEDIGVTAYKKHTFEELASSLAFSDGRPVQFSKFRSLSNTYDSWSDDKALYWEKGGSGMVEVQGQWHQLAGVCGMVDKVFVGKNEETKTSHILIADDVGLGKTLEMMMLLAFLMQVYVCENSTSIRKRPPIIAGGEFKTSSFANVICSSDN